MNDYNNLKRLGKLQKELSKLREDKAEIQAAADKKIAVIQAKRVSLRDERSALISVIAR